MAIATISAATKLRAATRQAQPARRSWRVDRWLVAVATLALVVSVSVVYVAYTNHTILLYSDAYSHMTIARRVTDNAPPGLAQLGGVWLPLPHLIMLPFVWNMTLWSSGLAGSIPSMICYIVSAVYIFMAARRVTKSDIASFLGTLVFLLNPNILFVQSTPLSEPVMIATMTMTGYYFLVWAQEQRQNDLIAVAFCTFLASLARYDGWALFLEIAALIALIGWQKRQNLTHVWGNLLLFGSLGGFGIALWFLWNLVIFHNPLFFLNGPYSSAVMQSPLIKQGLVATYHNPGQALYYYTVISIETMGPAIFALLVVAVVVFVARRRFTPETVAALAFLMPFAFYAVSLYTGQAVEYAPHAVPAGVTSIFYNDRYGTQAVAPAAFFIATLIATAHRFARPALVGIILAQSALTAVGGVITLQDGLYGVSCSPQRATTTFLAQHYDNGAILEDTYFQNPQDFAFTVGIDLKHVVYQGASAQWNAALANPGGTVHWMYMHPGDLVSQKFDPNAPAFLALFTPVAHDSDGTTLYRLNRAPLADHAITPAVSALHSACQKHQASGLRSVPLAAQPALQEGI
jgi:hypothetical protein